MVKKNNKNLHTKTTIVLLILVLIIIFSFYRGVAVERTKYPVLNTKGENFSYLYEFYTSNKPYLVNRPYYGDENAQITMIFYADTSSEKSKEFMQEIFPTIKQEYIDEGKIKFYHKHNIDLIDYQEKTDPYKFAQALLCINELYPDKYWNYYFNSFSLGVQENMNKENINSQTILSCMENTFEILQEDMSEAQKFKIQGVNPVIYLGVNERQYDIIIGTPSITKIKRVIRQKQLIIGD